MASLKDFSKALDKRDQEIEVKSYKRKKPTKDKPQSTTPAIGVEIPHVAPQAGDKIISVPKPGQNNQPPRRTGGVKIIGGGGG